ncbi:MFS transporter [Ferrovibrio sp. MS7]|uniref:MFS transporter n=1 Tax=Ferrovibrio plantarum TaxID=3119164 RepID=UPI0031358F49
MNALAAPLGAMTALQGLVAMGVFAVPVLAPGLPGFSAHWLGPYNAAVFGLGALASLYGGLLCGRIGPVRVAQICLLLVAIAMLCVASGSPLGLIGAALLLGCAFGPETPASSSVLALVAKPQQRTLVFSVRQTGNQIGAMLGSVLLPLAVLVDWRLGCLGIALLAVIAAGLFQPLRVRLDEAARRHATRLDMRGALALLKSVPGLGLLAGASLAFSAMQLTLNAYLVSYGVGALGFTLMEAGLWLALAQGGGLVGRLGWGLVAGRFLTTARLIALLGLSMAACALLLAAAGPSLSRAALHVLAFLFGLSASGWNGIFLAEVARLAPEGQVGAATGAALLASYSGLLLGPLCFAGLGPVFGLGSGYAALALLCIAASVPLLLGRRA